MHSSRSLKQRLSYIVCFTMEYLYYISVLIYPLVVSLIYFFIIRGKIEKQYQFIGFCFLSSLGAVSIIGIIRESLLMYYESNLKITCPESPTLFCDLGGFLYAWGFIPLTLFWLFLPPIINNVTKNIWLKAYGK